MDIYLLSKMVGELILDNDEVALPGVGTFVAELQPSVFSDKGYTINPPYRRLSFRQRESSDNSLLELYARSNGIDSRQAARIMGDFLSGLRETLVTRKTVIFPGLGRLRATRENNFFFIPDEDLNIYPEGFGLEPVSLKTHVETEDEMRAAVASQQEILDESSAVDSPANAEVSVSVETPVAENSPVVEERPSVEEVHAAEDVHVRRHRSVWWTVCAALAAFAILALVLFVILAHVTPGFIDAILYTPEELDIIRQMGL